MRKGPRHPGHLVTVALLTSACAVLASAPVTAGPPTPPAGTTATTAAAGRALADTRAPTPAHQPAHQQPDLRLRHVRLDGVHRQRRRRRLRRLPRRPADHPVAGSTLPPRSPWSPGVTWGCTSTPATPPATCRRPARPCRSPRRSARPTPTPPTAPDRPRPPRRPAPASRCAGPRRPTTSASRAYDVYRDGVKVGTVTGTATTPPATTFIDSGLAANTAYALPRRRPRRAGQRVAAQQHRDRHHRRRAAAAPVCAVTQVAHRHRHPVGPGHAARRHDPLHPAGRARHRPPQPGHRREDDASARCPNVAEHRRRGRPARAGDLADASPPTTGCTSCTPRRPTTGSCGSSTRTAPLDTGSEQVLLSGILRNKFHNGGRLRFGPDGKLYAATGDAQNGDNAQNINSLNGKVLRINPDGTVPSDNPFGNYVWSYGHRNPQGLAFDSQGRLWEQEFGNTVMDETNLIAKGGNYGWPACEGTCRRPAAPPGYIAPKHTYPVAPTARASGIAIVRDVLYVACERGTRMYRAVISGTSADQRPAVLRRHLRPAAHRRAGPGRRPVADHEHRRRQGQHPRTTATSRSSTSPSAGSPGRGVPAHHHLRCGRRPTGR